MFRRIKAEDCNMILKWRNSENVRLNMINQDIIEEDKHLIWFDKALRSANKYDIYEYQDRPVGLVSFTIGDDVKSAKWGFYLGKTNLPKGTGFNMCKESIDMAFADYGFDQIISEVFEDNIASLKIHQKLGFDITGKKSVDRKLIYLKLNKLFK